MIGANYPVLEDVTYIDMADSVCRWVCNVIHICKSQIFPFIIIVQQVFTIK